MSRFLTLLAAVAIIVLATVPLAFAQSSPDQQKRKLVLPSIRATTDCFTRGIVQRVGPRSDIPRETIERMIPQIALDGSCQGQIATMIQTHDRVFGEGSGATFYHGPYSSDLPRAVANRLKSPEALSASAGTAPATAPVSGPAKASTVSANDSQNAPKVSIAPPASNASGSFTDRLSKDWDEDSVKRGAGLFLGIILVCTFILFVLGCGSRIVVFKDTGDIGMSACIFIVPVATFIAFLGVGYLTVDDSQKGLTIIEEIKANLILMIILGLGALTWMWSILGTLISSIRNNGLIIGTFVAILKIGALLFLFLFWFGSLHNYNEKYNTDHVTSKLIIFGILAFIASKMVNGDRVYARRLERLAAREEMMTAAA